MEQACLYLGSKEIGLACLSALVEVDRRALGAVATIDDAGDARSALPGFRELCEREGLPLEVVTPRSLEPVLDALRPRVVIVVGWYWRIAERLLRKVPLGFVGVHASLLPRYRGGSPLVWAVINGEKEAGVTLFRLSEELDAGDYVDQVSFPIRDDDYIADVLRAASAAAVSLLKAHFADILSGRVTWKRQPAEPVSYCAARRPEDGRIDWGKSAREVYNFVRAQSRPYPGAFTAIGGRKLTVWRARPVDVPVYGTPGQVAFVGTDGVWVACGGGTALEILEVQEEGGEPLPAARVLGSHRVRLG